MADYSNIKVLIVDDDKEVADLIGKSIKVLGVSDFTLAFDGREAWAKYQAAETTTPYGLIICDMVMPHMDGVALLKKVRATNTKIPFMMLSGHTGPSSLASAKNSGADYYFLKPFDVKILALKIKAALDVINQ